MATQALQGKSFYAAKINIKQRDRATYAPPTAEEILAAANGPYQTTGCGDLPFVLHVGPKRAFVSKCFVPYGASQVSIGKSLGIVPKTVQRHQEALELNRRQIMQAKGEYRLVKMGIVNDADLYHVNDHMYFVRNGNSYDLCEKPVVGKKWQPPRDVSLDSFAEYYDKCWAYRCNVYEERFTLRSMKQAKKQFNKSLPTKQSLTLEEVCRKTDAESFATRAAELQKFQRPALSGWGR